MRFKPWSGKNTCEFEGTDVIKEEIEGIERIDEKEEDESCCENEKVDTFSDVSNMAKHD